MRICPAWNQLPHSKDLQHADASAAHPLAAFREQADCIEMGLAFLIEHACRQGLGGISIADRDGPLRAYVS